MANPVLRVEHLTLATDAATIVSDLSFEIWPGEIVALTGKSGSGKTSIASAILNLLPSDIHFVSGHIMWLGNHPLSLPKDQALWPALRGRHIGFTQQDVFGAFDPVMKTGRQMEAIVRERAINTNINILHELHVRMEEVGLHDIARLLNAYPHELSGGQLQRCQLAMAIVINPELLILDEPTSAVDKINQAELLSVFKMIRERHNMAILCITHEEDLVRQIASREIHLGKADGTLSSGLSTSVKQNNEADEQPVVLETKGLIYTHASSGIMYTQGATIGEINMRIRRGSSTGIVGESGSGKSTLAQLLVGLYPPANGEVLLDSQPVDFEKKDDVRRLRSKVQLVMQDGRGSLHPHLTIREVLSEVSHATWMPREQIEENLQKSLREVGLTEDMLDRHASQLSGGECLRISIARALLIKPEVLICDESTASLDKATTEGILQLLDQLREKKGLALVFISHDHMVIRKMAEYIIVLAEGKVIETGRATDIIQRPTHPISKRIFEVRATPEHYNRL